MLSVFTYANVSQSQKDALVVLYNTTNGDSWNTSWDLDQPITEWYGVTIENDQIVAINLSFNNLTGNLPSEISKLTSLRTLNLAFNKLEGKLPKTLTEMTSLETLQLFSNNFSGAIPTDIGRMENLKTLELYNNSFFWRDSKFYR